MHTAIYVPCLGVKPNGYLMRMAVQSLETAVELHQEGRAPTIIVSYGYRDGAWMLERALKLRFLRRAGVPHDAIVELIPDERSTNTYNEIRRLRSAMCAEGVHRLIVVAERWHAPRVMLGINLMMPGVAAEQATFAARRYELQAVVPWVKQFMTASRVIWIPYNAVLYCLTPLFALSGD